MMIVVALMLMWLIPLLHVVVRVSANAQITPIVAIVTVTICGLPAVLARHIVIVQHACNSSSNSLSLLSSTDCFS